MVGSTIHHTTTKAQRVLEGRTHVGALALNGNMQISDKYQISDRQSCRRFVTSYARYRNVPIKARLPNPHHVESAAITLPSCAIDQLLIGLPPRWPDNVGGGRSPVAYLPLLWTTFLWPTARQQCPTYRSDRADTEEQVNPKSRSSIARSFSR